MAKFLYKMQNVLDVKLKMEDQAKTVFGTAMAALLEEEAKLEALIRRKEEYEEEGRQLRSSVLNVMSLKENTNAIDNLKDQIVAQEQQVALAEEAVERARQKLQIAMQERKIPEKLKENAFEEFKQELNAAESKEVDELVSYRFGRKAAEMD